MFDRMRFAVGFVTISAMASGCIGDPGGPQTEQPVCEAAQAIRRTPGFTTVPEEADIAAKVLPGGFGGLYQDIGQGLVAFFKDAVAWEVKRDLVKLLECGGAYPGWANVLASTDVSTVILRQGQFTATELLTFFRALEPLKADPNVWSIEIDPETNRVWLGITEASELVRIRQAVTDRSVPLAAVQIEVPPPVTGLEQFEALDPAITPQGGEALGIMFAKLRMRFINRQSATRYPDWCFRADWASFLGSIEKWDGASWALVTGFVCIAILLPPRAVQPGEAVNDSVVVGGSRRLNTIPVWRTARTTGTYRFVGRVYTSTVPNPSGGHPLVSDLAPPAEQVSTPFRVLNMLPF